jgi:hypothetical protein
MPVSGPKSSRARMLKNMPNEEKFEIISEIKSDENIVVTPNAILDQYKPFPIPTITKKPAYRNRPAKKY